MGGVGGAGLAMALEGQGGSESRDGWEAQGRKVGFCHRPVRLSGGARTVDRATGTVMSEFRSSQLPDGVLCVRCGNRREAVCPPCSREYGGDMWHLLRAGAAGGDKGVPTSVTTHPMVFATLTAPSFGPVHVARTQNSGSRRCHPWVSRADSSRRCEHGRWRTCRATHTDSDDVIGQPLCPDCYNYPGQVVWQWWAPELWRRFTIALPRAIAAALGLSLTASRKRVRVSFAKVAEYQRRGAVHFHAIVRLDGPPPEDGTGSPYPHPLVDIDSVWLAERIREAAAAVHFTAPPVHRYGEERLLRFGAQVDCRPITLVSRQGEERDHLEQELAGPLHPEAVAAYIAKYATKSAGDLDPGGHGRTNPHLAQLRRTVMRLADAAGDLHPPGLPVDNPYALLGKWGHMLGFRGHFASKSRRYSTTLTRLRMARRRFQQAKARHPKRRVSADELVPPVEETTLVIGEWAFAGTGWVTKADAERAVAAAAAARERRRRIKDGSMTGSGGGHGYQQIDGGPDAARCA